MNFGSQKKIYILTLMLGAMSPSLSAMNNRQEPKKMEQDGYACANCTYYNYPDAESCILCETKRAPAAQRTNLVSRFRRALPNGAAVRSAMARFKHPFAAVGFGCSITYECGTPQSHNGCAAITTVNSGNRLVRFLTSREARSLFCYLDIVDTARLRSCARELVQHQPLDPRKTYRQKPDPQWCQGLPAEQLTKILQHIPVNVELEQLRLDLAANPAITGKQIFEILMREAEQGRVDVIMALLGQNELLEKLLAHDPQALEWIMNHHAAVASHENVVRALCDFDDAYEGKELLCVQSRHAANLCLEAAAKNVDELERLLNDPEHKGKVDHRFIWTFLNAANPRPRCPLTCGSALETAEARKRMVTLILEGEETKDQVHEGLALSSRIKLAASTGDVEDFKRLLAQDAEGKESTNLAGELLERALEGDSPTIVQELLDNPLMLEELGRQHRGGYSAETALFQGNHGIISVFLNHPAGRSFIPPERMDDFLSRYEDLTNHDAQNALLGTLLQDEEYLAHASPNYLGLFLERMAGSGNVWGIESFLSNQVLAERFDKQTIDHVIAEAVSNSQTQAFTMLLNNFLPSDRGELKRFVDEVMRNIVNKGDISMMKLMLEHPIVSPIIMSKFNTQSIICHMANRDKSGSHIPLLTLFLEDERVKAGLSEHILNNALKNAKSDEMKNFLKIQLQIFLDEQDSSGSCLTQ